MAQHLFGLQDMKHKETKYKLPGDNQPTMVGESPAAMQQYAEDLRYGMEVLSSVTPEMSVAERTAHRLYNQYKFDSLSSDVKKQLIILFLSDNVSAPKHISKYTDEELEMLLSDYPTLNDSDIAEVSDADYKVMVSNMRNKPQRNIERWL